MTTLVLPTFLIGPSQGARSSTILERSGPVEEVPEIERRLLGDLPLALAGWMRRREEDEIWGCLPLSRVQAGGRMLFRALYLRDLSGEPYGLASGLYLSRDALAAIGGHAERLAGHLPVPERGTAFTAAPLKLETAEMRPLPEGIAAGLEWDDRAVRIEDQTHPMLVIGRLLAGIRFAAPGRRVRGWVTTGHFPRLGAIDPRASFQLVVTRGTLPEDPYPAASWNEGQYHGNVSAPPPSWPAWQALGALWQDDPELAEACDWSGNLVGVNPPQVPQALIDRLLARTDGGAPLLMRLLVRLGHGGVIADPPRYLNDMIERGDDERRGWLLSGLFGSAEEVRDALHADDLLRKEPILATLVDPPAFERILKEHDYLSLAGLGDRHLKALPADLRFLAMDDAMGRIEMAPERSGRFCAVIQVLIQSLMLENDPQLRDDPRIAGLIQRIHRAEGILRTAEGEQVKLAPERVRRQYGDWLRSLPIEVAPEVYERLYRIAPRFPANLDEMAGLAGLIAAVNNAGPALRRGIAQ